MGYTTTNGWWKNVENRIIVSEVMAKSLVSCFFDSRCTCQLWYTWKTPTGWTNCHWLQIKKWRLERHRLELILKKKNWKICSYKVHSRSLSFWIYVVNYSLIAHEASDAESLCILNESASYAYGRNLYTTLQLFSSHLYFGVYKLRQERQKKSGQCVVHSCSVL